ncbi:hypothetical protein [Sporosarcina sp. FSL K6-1508]|uniref:hypothetical protein n=1 Tax=Sporosarcina sp. FSL K6-1508 TaxID=2921553 RepID=UPI0030F9421E
MSDITVPASIAMGIYVLIYIMYAVLTIGYYKKRSRQHYNQNAIRFHQKPDGILIYINIKNTVDIF